MINIIMVTKDRMKLFNQSIESLYKNTPLDQFNLTVVDDCSSEENRKEIKSLSKQYLFHLILNLEPTPLGGSKNIGVEFIKGIDRGDLLYLTDNDVYFTENWLSELSTAWKNKPEEIKLLGGGCHKWLCTNRIFQNGYYYKDAISGWSWLMDWGTWEKYGPMDANALGSGQSEDWAFCQKIKKDGFEVASIWPEVIIHCGKTNTEGNPAIGSETIDVPEGIICE